MIYLRLLLSLLIISPIFAGDAADPVSENGPLLAPEPSPRGDSRMIVRDAFAAEDPQELVRLKLQSHESHMDVEVNLSTIEASTILYQTYQNERRRQHGGVVEINLDVDNIHTFVHAIELLGGKRIDYIDNELCTSLILYANQFDIAQLWPIIREVIQQKNLADFFAVADIKFYISLFEAVGDNCSCQTPDKLIILNWLSDYVNSRAFHNEKYKRIYRQLRRKFKDDKAITRSLESTKERLDICSQVSQELVRAEQNAVYTEKAETLYQDKIFPQYRVDVTPGKPRTMYVAVPYAEADYIAEALNKEYPGFKTTVDIKLSVNPNSDEKPFPNNIYCCLELSKFLRSDLTKDWQGCVSYGIAWAINWMGPCLAKTLSCGCCGSCACCPCGRDLKQQESCEAAIKDALTDDTTGRCIFEGVYKFITTLTNCFNGPTRMLRVVEKQPAANIH